MMRAPALAHVLTTKTEPRQLAPGGIGAMLREGGRRQVAASAAALPRRFKHGDDQPAINARTPIRASSSCATSTTRATVMAPMVLSGETTAIDAAPAGP
jgi:hypothetical protein